jgi:putative transposase
MAAYKNSIELSVVEAAGLLGCNGSTLRRRCMAGRVAGARRMVLAGVQTWRIPLAGLGLSVGDELRYLQARGLVPALESGRRSSDSDLQLLDSLDGWQRDAVTVRKSVIDRFGLAPTNQWDELVEAIRREHPRLRVSRPTVYRWMCDYQAQGLAGLVPGYGKSRGNTSVPPEAAEIFDSLALQESEPSLLDVYCVVRGYCERMYPKVQLPGSSAFIRRFNGVYPRSYRDLRRKGYAYWQRHHEYFIPRDASGIPAGKGWFSDHHQLDTMVTAAGGRQVRPWATVWRDVRSGKILSCHLHEEAPNSDHIFYAFYLAVKEHGLPDFIYIDNGKDYRVRDFTGNTRRAISDDEDHVRKARALMGLLEVDVILAAPYNAQAKAVERDFSKIARQFGRFMLGYTGTGAGKRPETTKRQCAAGNLMSMRECVELFTVYIRDVFNRKANHGTLCRGKSPDEIFAANRENIRTVSAESLKLCLMRTSKPHRIDRNGISDRELGIELRYWGEWMYPLKGAMVYMRRDIQNYQECWVWQDDNDAFLGKALLAESIALRADTPVEREALKLEIARKREDLKRAKAASAPRVRLSGREIVESMARGAARESPDAAMLQTMGTPSVSYHITPLDHAAAEHERACKTGTYDMSAAVAEEPEKRELMIFGCERDE